MSESGTNFFARTKNPLVESCFIDENSIVHLARCNGNPNVVAVESGIYVAGCIMFREDLSPGQNLYQNTGDVTTPVWTAIGSGGGSGTVTDVSVATANGFSGTVATSTTTPVITIETTETGILFGDGTSIAGVPDGLGGQVLFTDGAGNYSFGTVPSAALTYKEVAYGDSLNVITSDGDFTRDPTTGFTTIIKAFSGPTFGELIVGTSSASLISDTGSLVSSNATGALLDFPIPGFTTTHNGFLASSTGAYIKTSTGSATTIAKWPTTHGAAGEVLTDDGTGILYWSSGSSLMLPLAQYHIYNGDAGGAPQDSGNNFLWDETSLTLSVGDLSNATNLTKILLDDANSSIKIYSNQGGAALTVGLLVDGAGQYTAIGDVALGGVLMSVDQTQEVAFMGNSNAFMETDGVNGHIRGWLTGNQSLLITTNNLFAGYSAGNSASSASRSTYLGALSAPNDTDGLYNTFVGYNTGATVTTGNSYITLLGASSDVLVDGDTECIALGYAAKTKRNYLVIGGDDGSGFGTISNISFGNGITNASPVAKAYISATGGDGTDIAGSHIVIEGGASTGNAIGGSVQFATSTPSASGSSVNTPTTKLTIDENGNIFASTLHNNATAQGDALQQDIRSGTYTPTLTNVTNISASTAYECQWFRVGNVVTVSGKVDFDPTAVGACQLGMSLPVPSDFGNDYECAGTSVGENAGVFDDASWIKADTTNDRAAHFSTAVGVANHSHWFTFTYQVI